MYKISFYRYCFLQNFVHHIFGSLLPGTKKMYTAIAAKSECCTLHCSIPITYPNGVYKVATAAIFIQTRGVQSVFSLEMNLVGLCRLPCKFDLFPKVCPFKSLWPMSNATCVSQGPFKLWNDTIDSKMVGQS